MTKHTIIFAKITPKTEYFDIAKEAIQEITPMTQDEAGCLNFTLHEDGAGSLYLYEEWLDDEALEEHYRMDYTRAVFESYKSWLATPPEITKLEKLS